jgi:hypothetical protein
MASELPPKGRSSVDSARSCHLTQHDRFLQASSRTIERPYPEFSSVSVIGAQSHKPILVSSAIHTSHKRRKGGTCRMILRSLGEYGKGTAFTYTIFTELFSLHFLPGFTFLTSGLAIFVFQHGIKAAVVGGSLFYPGI